MRESQSEKHVISAAVERKQCFLLNEAYLAACSRGWVQHCGITLRLNLFFVFLPNPETLSLHREKKWRGRDGLYWEIGPGDTVVWPCIVQHFWLVTFLFINKITPFFDEVV